MKNELFYIVLLIVVVAFTYFYAYGKGISPKKWLPKFDYVFCGVTYTGYIILAEYYGPKQKTGKQKVFFANGIDSSTLKLGHVYSFEPNGTTDKIYRVDAIPLFQGGFASAILNNPVVAEKIYVL